MGHVISRAEKLDNLLDDVKKEMTSAQRFDSGGIDDIIECITAAIKGDFQGACDRLKNGLTDSAKSAFANFKDAVPPTNSQRDMCKRWYPNIQDAKGISAACEDDEECESGLCVHVRGIDSASGSKCSPRDGFGRAMHALPESTISAPTDSGARGLGTMLSVPNKFRRTATVPMCSIMRPVLAMDQDARPSGFT